MKKAVIQMQETILVVFIITIIIVLGLFVFQRYNLNSLEQAKLEYEEIRNYNLLATLPNNPQLQYTLLNNPENSIDTLKLLNLRLDIIGDKEIIVRQLYPDARNITCTHLNYPDCNSYLIYSKIPRGKSINIITLPISLYFPLTDEYKAGLLEIKWYY